MTTDGTRPRAGSVQRGLGLFCGLGLGLGVACSSPGGAGSGGSAGGTATGASSGIGGEAASAAASGKGQGGSDLGGAGATAVGGAAGNGALGGGGGSSVAPPSELALSVVGDRIQAVWRDNSDNELGFRMAFSTEPVRAGAPSVTVPANAVTAATLPLPTGARTPYHVWVSAYGASAESPAIYGTISFPDGETPLWSDEFDGPAIRLDNWGFDSGAGGWGNAELQTYTNGASNAFIADGMLVIRALRSGNGYTSARLVTRDKRRFRYGRIEARIKGPSVATTAAQTGLTDPGAWPAFWLLPQDNAYGGWPSSGEIDIWELGGLQPSVISGAVHWNGSSAGSDPVSHSRTRTLTAPAANDFHVYGITWSETFIRWYVDGQEILAFDHTQPLAGREPFKEDFYVVLNLAVGGSFARTGDPNPANYPQSLYVDWIRYYP